MGARYLGQCRHKGFRRTRGFQIPIAIRNTHDRIYIRDIEVFWIVAGWIKSHAVGLVEAIGKHRQTVRRVCAFCTYDLNLTYARVRDKDIPIGCAQEQTTMVWISRKGTNCEAFRDRGQSALRTRDKAWRVSSTR